MSSSFFYEERDPPENLAHAVQCAWYFRRAALPEHIDTVYPDGCCELIVHLREPPLARSLQHEWHQQGRCLFAGQIRQGFQMKSDHELACVGIRLRPAASAALGLPGTSNSRDRVFDARTLNQRLADELLSAVEDNAADEGGWPRLDKLWRTLSPLLAAFRPDRRIEAAVERIRAANGQDPVSRLAEESGMSLRSFQQQFRQEVGLTPKEFARIMRLQATLELLDAEDQPISHVAAEAGFSDQSHASRELKRTTGLTPRDLQMGLKNHRDDEHTLQMAAAFIRGYSGMAE